MKRTTAVTRALSLALIMVALVGCSGIQLNADYSKLLDETAALSNEAATRAEANTLTPADQVKALRWNADAWDKFRKGRDGVK